MPACQEPSIRICNCTAFESVAQVNQARQSPVSDEAVALPPEGVYVNPVSLNAKPNTSVPEVTAQVLSVTVKVLRPMFLLANIYT